LTIQKTDFLTVARRNLTELLAAPGPLDVVEAALWVAAEEYPDLEVKREVARVHILSAEGARLAEVHDNPFAKLDGIRRYLYEELGFRGNALNYNDPRNSFLNEVLNRRIGIPLTISILFMAVAEAAGFDVRGVNLPGHFVIRLTYGGRNILVDPYHGGQVITQDDCRELVRKTTARPSLFKAEQLEGIDDQDIIGRMLLNLKHVYLELDDNTRALSVVNRMLLIKPGDPSEIRDRGLLRARIGRLGPAIDDLEHYLNTSPKRHDSRSVRGRLSWLRQRLSEMN
jgi:regulator of sirC expression with transglutaminase-like and TPR domain